MNDLEQTSERTNERIFAAMRPITRNEICDLVIQTENNIAVCSRKCCKKRVPRTEIQCIQCMQPMRCDSQSTQIEVGESSKANVRGNCPGRGNVRVDFPGRGRMSGGERAVGKCLRALVNTQADTQTD